MPRPGPVGTCSMPSASARRAAHEDLLDIRHARLKLDPAGHRHRGRQGQIGRHAHGRVPAVRHQQHAVVVRPSRPAAGLRSGRRTWSVGLNDVDRPLRDERLKRLPPREHFARGDRHRRRLAQFAESPPRRRAAALPRTTRRRSRPASSPFRGPSLTPCGQNCSLPPASTISSTSSPTVSRAVLHQQLVELAADAAKRPPAHLDRAEAAARLARAAFRPAAADRRTASTHRA